MQTIGKPRLRRPGSSTDGKGPLASRGGTIAAALLAAVLAAVTLVLFLNQYKERIDSDAVATRVLVAAKVIDKGASGSAIAARGLAETVEIRKGDLEAGAITDASALKGKVAAHEILPGTQLTRADFIAPSNAIATDLASNQRALTLSLDRAHGMIGNVAAGDHVDVYSGFMVDTGSGRPRPMLRLLAQDVLVLDMPAGGEASVQPNSVREVVVRLGSLTAPKVAFAAEYGKVWLALRPANGTSAAARPLVTIESLLLDQLATARSIRTGR